MAPTTTVDGSIDGLKALIQSATSLITQLEQTLAAVAYPNGPSPDPSTSTSTSTPSPSRAHDAAPSAVDVFALAHDAATLVRAHATKLSLLIINEPFTPSAIAKVLRELVAGPVPAIASAVQLCDPATHTGVVRHALAWRCSRVLSTLRSLVEAIPLDGTALPAQRKNGANGDRGSLVVTGLVWAACDDVILLRKLGIAGLLKKTVEEYRDTLQDVIEELKEWGEEEDDEDDDEDDEDDNDLQHVVNGLEGTHLSAQDMIDELMTGRHIPRDDPDRIRERLDSCLKRLRLTTLLYSAVIKRRIQTLPSLPTDQATSVTRRLDEVYPILKELPRRFGDVACAFYELDTRGIDSSMDSCFLDAFAAAEMLKAPWTGTADPFTEWADKFQISIKKPD